MPPEPDTYSTNCYFMLILTPFRTSQSQRLFSGSATDSIYIFFFFFLQGNASLQRPVGGVGSPRGLSKSTFVTMSLVTVVSLVYAACQPTPRVRIIVFIPPILDLREYHGFSGFFLILLFKGRHQNSPLRATNCFMDMLVSCFCGFCGMSQKALTTICEWCRITI